MVGFSLTFLSEELCVSYQLEKKKHNIESCELFHLGHNEGYSLGDSISESSEELPYRGRAGVSINRILVKWEIDAIKHIVVVVVVVSEGCC